jgi:hypothetical protein
MVGDSAGYSNSTGIGNVFLGADAGYYNTTGCGNTLIQPNGIDGGGNFAYNPVFALTTENNRVAIGSAYVTNAYVQVAWTAVSDLRDKVVLGDVPVGLDFINKLKPIKFQFKKDRDSSEVHGPVKYGFGAQDVLAIEGNNPVIVDNEQPEKLKMTDSHLIPALVKAIQELSAKVAALEAKNA